MNIKQAKEQIKNAMTAYFARDELGCYRIPVEKQRPIIIMGPPGIGKTAIMEQIASELGVGLVSYSMTHHTRQSALGLPFIVDEEFGGFAYRVSEYTMSEIIGSVYRLMRETGLREGILFLDEINCVSETLAPCMLQFLQYKVFGQHRVPDGWIVVTAGNPPQYNKSVRDFDIVTWDRLKRIDVEPDYDVWKEYAYKHGIHASVMTYLAARKKDFYMVESAVEGRNFVTARGWEDLSMMIRLYEDKGLPVEDALICQYIQNRRISRDFALYYDLYRKYRDDYRIQSILDGSVPESVISRARQAPFDEQLSLLGLLLDAVIVELRDVIETEDLLKDTLDELKAFREELPDSGFKGSELLEIHAQRRREALVKGKKASSLSVSDQRRFMLLIALLEKYRDEIIASRDESFALIKTIFDRSVSDLGAASDEAANKLDNVFIFCENAFPDGQLVLILVTELTANYHSARFIGTYGCERYFAHNRDLQFNERRQEILNRMEKLNL